MIAVVRLAENGGVFELQETEVEVFGEKAGHLCTMKNQRERQNNERDFVSVCLI